MANSWEKSPAEIANSEVLGRLHFHTAQHFVAGMKCEQQAAIDGRLIQSQIYEF